MTWGYVLFAFVLVPGVLLAYLWLGIWSVRRLSRTTLPLLAKGPAIVVLVTVFVVAPFWDEIVGRYRFADLCKSGALVRINRVVTLDKRFMSPEGWPLTELVPGRPGLRIGGRYTFRTSDETLFASPRISKALTQVHDDVTGDVLGEIVDYRYWGGWLVQWLPGHRSAETCPELREKQVPLDRLIFRPVAQVDGQVASA